MRKFIKRIFNKKKRQQDLMWSRDSDSIYSGLIGSKNDTFTH
jgi:hypothetical protein